MRGGATSLASRFVVAACYFIRCMFVCVSLSLSLVLLRCIAMISETYSTSNRSAYSVRGIHASEWRLFFCIFFSFYGGLTTSVHYMTRVSLYISFISKNSWRIGAIYDTQFCNPRIKNARKTDSLLFYSVSQLSHFISKVNLLLYSWLQSNGMKWSCVEIYFD